MDNRKFEVECNAGEAGLFHAKTDSLSIRIGQRVRGNGIGELWGSVLVHCQDEKDGSLVAKVIVCHPDWEEPLQIAAIKSVATSESNARPVLQVDLKQMQA